MQVSCARSPRKVAALNNLGHVREELRLVRLYGPALTAPDRSELDELAERLVTLAVEDEAAEIEEDGWYEDEPAIDPRTAEIGEVFWADVSRGTGSHSPRSITPSYADHLSHLSDLDKIRQAEEDGEVFDLSNPRLGTGRGHPSGLHPRQRPRRTITLRRPN